MAAFLDWPQIVSALSIEASNGRLRVTREIDGGQEDFETGLPALISVARADENDVEAADGRVDVWTATDLVDDLADNDKRFGQPGSPTRVLAVRDATPERAAIRTAGWQSAAEAVGRLLEEKEPARSSWDKPPHVAEEPAASFDAWSVVETPEARASGSIPIPPGEIVTQKITCPAGQHVISGGQYVFSALHEARLTASRPFDSGDAGKAPDDGWGASAGAGDALV